MVLVTFPNRETERKALAFLLGRFSGRALKGGNHLVPEAALEALAAQDIPFTVKGRASYAQQVAAIRGAPAPPVQRRRRRSRLSGWRMPSLKSSSASAPPATKRSKSKDTGGTRG